MLTSFGRARRLTERAAKRLLRLEVDVLELDVNSADDLAALTSTLRERWGGVDGALARDRVRARGRARAGGS